MIPGVIESKSFQRPRIIVIYSVKWPSKWCLSINTHSRVTISRIITHLHFWCEHSRLHAILVSAKVPLILVVHIVFKSAIFPTSLWHRFFNQSDCIICEIVPQTTFPIVSDNSLFKKMCGLAVIPLLTLTTWTRGYYPLTGLRIRGNATTEKSKTCKLCGVGTSHQSTSEPLPWALSVSWSWPGDSYCSKQWKFPSYFRSRRLNMEARSNNMTGKINKIGKRFNSFSLYLY